VSRLVDGFRLALGTLTVLPARPPRVVDQDSGGWAMTLAPLVGAILAVIGAALLALLGWAQAPGPIDVQRSAHLHPPPAVLAAALVVGALALLTRAMHLDGLADTADGLGSRKPAQAALEVMRRSDIGPFGVVTLVLMLLLQVLALGQLTAVGRGVPALLLALVVSRAVLPVVCRRGVPPARPDGLGRVVAGTVGPGRLAVAAALAVLVLLAGKELFAVAAVGGFAVPGSTLLGAGVATVLGLAAGAGFCWWCVRLLGGVTGDVLGACVEVTFTAVLVVLTLLF
jgi:adenosylcobinamide-GDP ribazoletransferase